MVKHPRLAFCLEQRKKYPETPHTHPTAIIHDCVKLGRDVTIHEYCTIGTQGFGHARQNGEWLHIPQIGGVRIGDRVEIYPGTNIDRGTVQDTIIGDGTKIDHHCHIGHNVKIGCNCIIAAGTIIAGSTVIGNDCWIGPGSTIKEHLKIGDQVLIGMASNVLQDVRSNVTVVGNPARILRSGNIYLEEEIHNSEK